MINILCFGDSNTFGTNPAGGRWPLHERWTGVLQALLGDGYRVIEEGCGGRTTVMDDDIEMDKNGRKHLPVALRSHRPLDMVILMLGSNDLKHRFSRLPVDIAYSAAELGKLVTSYDYGAGYPIPKVLLVSPAEVKPGVSDTIPGFTEQAVECSKQFAPLYKRQADANGWLYFDAATVTQASDRDKCHFEKESHLALARALAPVVRAAFE